MPALPPVPGVVRLDAHWNAGGVIGSDRFFLGYSGSPPNQAQAATFATQFQGTFQSHIAALLSSLFNYNLFVVTDLSSSTGWVGTNGTQFSGTRAGAALPVNVCVLMNGHVRRRYRGGKPRMYPPWGVDPDIGAPTIWTTSFQSLVNAAWAQVISDLSVTPWTGATITGQVSVSYYQGYETPTLVSPNHYKNHVAARAVPLVDPISSMTCNLKVGTQRRRVAA